MTADQLRDAELRHRATQEAAEDARRDRNSAVCEALEEGWTHARIAEATGLTRGRVGQIAQTR
jgi:DNA-binding NarL/FixJ family response regulator